MVHISNLLDAHTKGLFHRINILFVCLNFTQDIEENQGILQPNCDFHTKITPSVVLLMG